MKATNTTARATVLSAKIASDVEQMLKTSLTQVYSQLSNEMEKEKLELKKEREILEKEIESFNKSKEKMQQVLKFTDNIIRLDVGGVLYSTTRDTLRAVPNSLLDCMFSGNYPVNKDENGRYFIDRNGELFSNILDFLRNGFMIMPSEKHVREQLLVEAEYYGLDMISSNNDTSVDQILSDWAIEMSSLYVSASNTADALRDKNLTTGCATNNSTNEWLKVKFNQPFEFIGVKIGPLLSGGWDAYTTNVQLQYSTNEKDWNHVTSLTALISIVEYKFPEPITAQYWLLSRNIWFSVGYLEFF